MIRQTFAKIDLDAFKRNVGIMRGIIGDSVLLMAVVKADAYGHGLVPIAHAAQDAGADWLGVALAEEGVIIRESGIRQPILLLAGQGAEGSRQAVAHGLTLTAFTPEHLEYAQSAAISTGLRADIHLKLDTGMNRIGLKTVEELKELLDKLKSLPRVRLCGAFTHFACADSRDPSFTDRQLACFRQMVSALPEGILLHASGTSAIIKRPDARFHMARAGLALYGYSPVETDAVFEPVLSFMAEITHVKTISAGDSVSYGARYTAQKDTRVATLAVGYGDGYCRDLSQKGEVLINGRRCRVLGTVCMDQIMADVSDAGPVIPGDQAVLIGKQGENSILAHELASLTGTIPYEILLAISKRVPRVYTQS